MIGFHKCSHIIKMAVYRDYRHHINNTDSLWFHSYKYNQRDGTYKSGTF